MDLKKRGTDAKNSDDELLREAEELLVKTNLEDAAMPMEEADSIDHRIIEQEIETSEVPINLNLDGCAEIRISDDEMTAHADFYPPSRDGKLISLEHFQKRLERSKVVSGVDWDLISEKIFECNTDRKEISDLVIARGNKPEDEIPEHLELVDGLLDETHHDPSDGEKMDYRAISPYKLVKEGDVLANLIPKKEGVMGKTVLGRSVSYHVEKQEMQLVPGENVTMEKGGATAACDGRFMYREGTFFVRNVLVVEGDVDYKTGHIDFPGDVLIIGYVHDGFNIKSGKSISCKKSLNATKVTCGENLLVEAGIIGRKEAMVKVGGTCEATFMENCHVEAGGSILIHRTALNSFVYSQDTIETGAGGKVIGGKLFSKKGIQGYQFGNQSGTKTELICGTDYIVQNNLALIRDKIVELTLYAQQIKAFQPGGGGNVNLAQNKAGRVEELLGKLQDRARELLSQLDECDQSEIVVKEKMYPGCYVEICHVPYVVTRLLQRVKLRLEKEKGKITIVPLIAKETI